MINGRAVYKGALLTNFQALLHLYPCLGHVASHLEVEAEGGESRFCPGN